MFPKLALIAICLTFAGPLLPYLMIRNICMIPDKLEPKLFYYRKLFIKRHTLIQGTIDQIYSTTILVVTQTISTVVYYNK